MTYGKKPQGRWHRLYTSTGWIKLRAVQLKREPYCKFCMALGHPEIANVVDHIKKHGGNERLFFDSTNLQSLCKQCHDSTKQQIEKSGTYNGFDVNGWPLDHAHYFNKKI